MASKCGVGGLRDQCLIHLEMTKSSGDGPWRWLRNSGDALNVTGAIKMVKTVYVVAELFLTIQKKKCCFCSSPEAKLLPISSFS